MARKLSAKQIAAGFGGKRRSSRKGKSKGTSRRAKQTVVSLGKVAAPVAILAKVIKGNGYAGVLQMYREQGLAAAGLRAVDGIMLETTGVDLNLATTGQAGPWNPGRAIDNLEIALAGYGAHKVADFTGANNGIRSVQRATLGRVFVVV